MSESSSDGMGYLSTPNLGAAVGFVRPRYQHLAYDAPSKRQYSATSLSSFSRRRFRYCEMGEYSRTASCFSYVKGRSERLLLIKWDTGTTDLGESSSRIVSLPLNSLGDPPAAREHFP